MGIRSQNNTNPLAAYLDVFSSTGTDAAANAAGGGGGAPQGLTASGGVISDYVSGPFVYRAHVFTSSGALNVSALSASLPNNVEYVVVGGGGGSGYDLSGGGGAGGYRSSVTGESTGGGGSLESAVPVVVATYPISIGAGGAGYSVNSGGGQGGPSTFGGPSFTDVSTSAKPAAVESACGSPVSEFIALMKSTVKYDTSTPSNSAATGKDVKLFLDIGIILLSF